MRTVDITSKIETLREARAYGRIRLRPETVKLIRENKIPKGNLVEATKLSGIFGAKKTGELLPFCHPIPLDFVALEVKVNEGNLEVFSTVRGIARTGYEMEALTAVATALLNVYDMCKALDDSMVIEEIKLLEKSGGKSDWFKKLQGVKVNLHSSNKSLKRIAEEYLKDLGATLAEEGEVYISIGDNLPISKEIKSLESVISVYDFRRNPKDVDKEIKVGWSDGALIIILPESEEKVRFFFETFGGIIGNFLCKR